MNNHVVFEVIEDGLLRKIYTEDQRGIVSVRTEPIITKEAFIECYKKWIEGEKDESV